MNLFTKFAVCSATIGVMALPSLLLVRSASAQLAQSGQGGLGGGGGFGGLAGGGGFGGAQGGGFGGGAPQGMGGPPLAQGPAPIGQIAQDTENLYVTRGETIFKLSKHDLRILAEVTLPRPRPRLDNGGPPRPRGGFGQGLGGGRGVPPPNNGPIPPPPGGGSD